MGIYVYINVLAWGATVSGVPIKNTALGRRHGRTSGDGIHHEQRDVGVHGAGATRPAIPPISCISRPNAMCELQGVTFSSMESSQRPNLYWLGTKFRLMINQQVIITIPVLSCWCSQGRRQAWVWRISCWKAFWCSTVWFTSPPPPEHHHRNSLLINSFIVSLMRAAILWPPVASTQPQLWD